MYIIIMTAKTPFVELIFQYPLDGDYKRFVALEALYGKLYICGHVYSNTSKQKFLTSAKSVGFLKILIFLSDR